MAIGRGLTFISGKEDSANYFIRRAIHTIYTFIFCIMLLAVMIIYILGDVIVSKMLVRLDDFDSTNLIDVVTGILSLVKIIFAPTILFGVLLVAYWALPVNKVKIKTAVPGAVFTAIIWMVLSFAVSYYINIIGLNTYMYGSLGSVVILALWMYMCMYVMLIGAEINKLVETIKYEKKNKKQAKSQ
jgi:membrane protein